MRFGGIIFDMDGTLLDTLEDLANSMNSVLKRFGYPSHATGAYRYFLGEGMRTLVERALPAGHRNRDTIEDCATEMRKEYGIRWTENSKPYPGISELLNFLELHNIPKAILSNKPHDFTVEMARVLLPEWFFCQIRGESPVTPRKPDPAAALEIAAGMGAPPKDILYLGDSGTDMQTAMRAGMYAVGALWGFRTAKELKENGSKTLVKDPGAVISLLAEMP